MVLTRVDLGHGNGQTPHSKKKELWAFSPLPNRLPPRLASSPPECNHQPHPLAQHPSHPPRHDLKGITNSWALVTINAVPRLNPKLLLALTISSCCNNCTIGAIVSRTGYYWLPARQTLAKTNVGVKGTLGSQVPGSVKRGGTISSASSIPEQSLKTSYHVFWRSVGSVKWLTLLS